MSGSVYFDSSRELKNLKEKQTSIMIVREDLAFPGCQRLRLQPSQEDGKRVDEDTKFPYGVAQFRSGHQIRGA